MSEAAPTSLPAQAALAPPPAPRVRRQMQPLLWRLQSLLGSYLPLLLMAMLAALSWWLVKNTPMPDSPNARPELRHEPDYQMKGFELQRFKADGSLSVQIKGRELRHFPDTDTVEIDGIELQARSPDGLLLTAQADRGLANADASDVQLLGHVRVQRYAAGESQGAAPQLGIEGEFLQVFSQLEKLRSHLPVTLSTAAGSFSTQSFEFDNLSGELHFKGLSRGSFRASAHGAGAHRP